MFENCWITTNRSCNIRCSWCYAKTTGYRVSNISINSFKRVLSILKDLNIKHITLLGGEPTCNADLPELIRLASENKIYTTLVTNGLNLDNMAYLDTLLDSGLTSIDISLKGSSEDDYITNTGSVGFNRALRGIENVTKRSAKLSVSTVISEANQYTYPEGFRAAKMHGAVVFSLSFCYDFSLLTNNKKWQDMLVIEKHLHLIDSFIESYPELCEITGERFSLLQSYPLCMWEPKIIQQMMKKNQINSICQLQTHSGLLFDTDFSIIPCNSMMEIKLGQLDIDFTDAKSLIAHIESQPIRNAFSYLASAPDKICVDCELWQVCGGGCLSFWLNHKFDDIIPYRKSWGIACLQD